MPADEDDKPEDVKATEEEVAAEAAKGGEKAADVKIILLGDSAVGKSKLVERYLMGDFHPRQLSTFALTLYRKEATVKEGTIQIDFWDTAGQERFNSMHPSYYFQAHCCILVFDVTRKNTYKHMQDWLDELRTYREEIPIICVANKIDEKYSVTKKKFKFPIENKVCCGLVLFVFALDASSCTACEQRACWGQRRSSTHRSVLAAALCPSVSNDRCLSSSSLPPTVPM